MIASMEKPVIISIKGIQTGDTIGEETMELVTQGILGQDQDGFSLTYEESELTGLEGTTTTFRIGKDRITLHREGTLRSDMIFQEGQRHFSTYETPYGGLILGVDTHRARSDIGRSGGDLEIRYALEVENEKVGENFFEIHVQEPTALL